MSAISNTRNGIPTHTGIGGKEKLIDINNNGSILTCDKFDNTIRWTEGERLDHLFEEKCDQLEDKPAVVVDGKSFTYRELDDRANQLARYLQSQGLKSGDRVGLILNKSFNTYVSLLAVLKINAAYVPLDASFPQDRIAFISQDAEVKAIVTNSNLKSALEDVPVPFIFLDEADNEISKQKSARLSEEEKGEPVDELTYIIYTSGSTGNPKGVAIEHPSICNFCRVAVDAYGIREDDRMYQGLTIAFDFSVEEIWLAIIAGATLVPGRPDISLVGEDLADFLFENKVTAMCCVPTLLATIDRDLPDLRYLMVSGEACPQDLVTRWHTPGRTMLNAYGPTEATVTCTWGELYPDKPVTIGGPLPTYYIVMLDENQNLVPEGEQGEICVAGIGLAKGYVNLEKRTEESFIPDFLNLPDNPSKRIYRTGDLGRITEEGEIEYLGRIDTQVKIRGYRIELAEIETVLLEVPGIAQAVVNVYEPAPGTKELAAYCTLKEGVSELPAEALAKTLKGRLPGYMVPAYIETIDLIPMLPSHKADRKKLPDPSGPRFALPGSEYVAPESEMEKSIAEIFAEIMGIEKVSVNDHFFEELGANSLMMAKFSSLVRERLTISDFSIRDLYLCPTVAKLSEFLESKKGEPVAEKISNEPFRKPTRLEYYGCGALQFAYYYLSSFLTIGILILGLMWSLEATSESGFFLRLSAFSIGAFFGSILLPIAMKWALVGRWKAETFPIWSLKYFRFWVVKKLIQSNPIWLFRNTPVFNIYLRLLGAKIGKNVVLFTKKIPVCTDLIEIGDNTIFSKDSLFLGYKAQSGYIQMGNISVGRNAFIGEGSVLDIDTRMEDDTQLGHASSLQSTQTVPVGKRYHGSPAEETTTNYNRVEKIVCSPLRRTVYALMLLSVPIASLLFLLAEFKFMWAEGVRGESFLETINNVRIIALQNMPIGSLFGYSIAIFASAFFLRLLAAFAVPRVLGLLLSEKKTYPLYGFHYFIFTAISALSNSKLFNKLFGDSSYILYYLNLIGIKASMVEQTGSNFGTSQKHEIPTLCEIGKGTMVSDGLAMMNAEISSSSFRVSKVSIGEDNFFGNNIFFPAGGKMGNNCLMATKALIPLDGPVRENIGILGSPAFEIPRSVDRDKSFDSYKQPGVREKYIRKKNLFNLLSMATSMVVLWGFGYLSLLLFHLALVGYGTIGLLAPLALLIGFPYFFIGYFVLAERLSLGFGKLKPQICSIYEKDFWRVENYWKLSQDVSMAMFKGTPFKNVMSRLVGVKVGKMVFDDGCHVTEKSLAEIGDYCTLNEVVSLQSHSLEDGVFKSGMIKLGNGSTVGLNAYIHYDVTLGENVVITADSFVMKGTSINGNSTWGGNPAREL
ncbi:MAG: amino acid adenylation domain-containing protein [Verrucomicrobiales bacterium]|nr:amino acid adenylation domain-containing protein [Verrucomicrobiales bacterium]